VLAKVDASGYIAVPASGYYNFGATTGTSGYGVRDNGGTVEIKNSGGSWAAPGGGTPGGSNTQIQYNNSSAFGGAAALTYAASGTNLKVTSQNASDKPLVIQGASSQSGDLLTVQDSSSAALVTVSSGGNLGVGTNAPNVKLDVNGTIVSRAYNAGSSTSIDWSQGNVQYTTANCGAFTFTNMQDGGFYTLGVEGSTSATCSFSHTGLTFKMPQWHGATTVSTMALYSFVRMGANVFVTYITGY
jgi:hypothetical protein